MKYRPWPVPYSPEAFSPRTPSSNRCAAVYGWDRKKNFFGPGRDGIKLNVFTSGPPIPPETAAHLFEEGVRGENASGEYGTGHGLYFIREVVRLHGGVEGYEATSLGNNFFFILPMEPVL